MNAATDEAPRLHRNRQTLSLSFETSLIQSCMSLADPDELVLDYTRAMMGFLLLNPQPSSILMIGLGGGSMLKYLHRHLPATDFTAVEIDPRVIALRQDFHIPPDDDRLRIVCADGARFVAAPTRSYDVILVDGFTGQGLPEALCSRSFYRRCQGALAPEGVLVLNVQADTGPTRTLLQRLCGVFEGGVLDVESDEGGNVVAMGGPVALFDRAASDFEARWAGLAPVHQATLAASSTRWARALIRHRRPSRPPAAQA